MVFCLRKEMPNAYILFQGDYCSASTYSTKYKVIYFLLRSFLGLISTSLWSSTNAFRFRVFLTGSSSGKSGDTRLWGCRIGDNCDWVNSCRLGLSLGVRFWTSTWFNSVWFGCLIGDELAKALPATDTALTCSVSDSELESPDPRPVALVARPAFWAAVILPRLFSRATALVSWIWNSLPALYSASIGILPPKSSIKSSPTLLSSSAGYWPEIRPCRDITLYRPWSPNKIRTGSRLLSVLRRILDGITRVAISPYSNSVMTPEALLCLTIWACVRRLCSATRFSISVSTGSSPRHQRSVYLH